jgi:chemotaxis protein histidine kinase CheA
MEAHEIDDERWLRDMRSLYVSKSDDKLIQLDQAVSGLESSPDNPVAYRRLDHLLHNLIGSGGSYGLPDVSEAARQMLRRLKDAKEAHDMLTPALIADLREGMARLRSVFSKAALE